MVYIPLATEQLYLAGNQYLSTIDVQAASAGVMTQVQNDITSLLLQLHGISDPTKADFSVLNQADILASASSITTTLTYLLGAIAGISLLVGGIGIMNMMLTTVTERTREIGLRKAIGAKQGDISFQFLTEAVALTLIGGVTGIVLGVGHIALISISRASSRRVFHGPRSRSRSAFRRRSVSPLAGIPPAARHALNPIEALRYE